MIEPSGGSCGGGWRSARSVSTWRSAIGAVGELVLPADCPGCGATEPLCGRCRSAVTGPALPRPASADLGAVWAVADYDDTVGALIRSWKDGGRHDLTPALATGLAGALAAAWQDAGRPRGALVVPVPTTVANRRRRGADLVATLALRAVRQLQRRSVISPGDLTVAPVLRYRRAVRDQAGLGAQQRSRNLHGSMWVPARHVASLTGRSCLVVDDVITTGATAAETARALRAAAARVPAVAAVAHTPALAGPAKFVGDIARAGGRDKGP